MAPSYPNHGRIDGPVVIIGFGSIGQGTLPLIERHFTYDPRQVYVIDPSDDAPDLPRAAGRSLHPPGRHARQLPRAADAALPRRPGLLREPLGRHQLARADAAHPRARRPLHRHRHRALGGALLRPLARRRPTAPTTRCARRCGRRSGRTPGGTTAVSCCGANPGMVSWLLKEALLRLAADTGPAGEAPRDRAGWARLMQRLGVKGVHIAERDTQAGRDAKPIGSFVNTWSVEGFVSESFQPAELGWGTHERWFPPNGHRQARGLQGGDLSRHAGDPDQGPHLDPGGRAAVRLSRHPQRGGLDRRLLHHRRGRRAGVSARPATTPTTPATRRCCRCTRRSGRARCRRR